MASISENFAYLAGLLDGEGCVTYKKYWDRKRKDRPRKYFCWRIQMEIVMTHKPTIQWCADTFGGKVYEKPRGEHKMQYRWRRSFRDALEIAKAIVPFSVTKKDALQQIINHYKNDRVRGTSPAELRSSGPKHSAERPATTPGVGGESARRGVSSDDMEYQSGGAYRAMIKLFRENLKNENNT